MKRRESMTIDIDDNENNETDSHTTHSLNNNHRVNTTISITPNNQHNGY